VAISSTTGPTPEPVIGIGRPGDALRGDEDAGLPPVEKFRDPAADIAKIEIGGAGVAHVDRALTAEVDAQDPVELRVDAAGVVTGTDQFFSA
jgi:hypothetical protein